MVESSKLHPLGLEHSNIMMLALYVIAALFVMAKPAGAEEIASLKQSVEYALDHNRMLGASSQSLEQADANLTMATGSLLPRVDLSTGMVRTNSPGDYFGMKLNQKDVTAADFNPAAMNNPGYVSNYQTRVNVSVPVFQGGALWAGRSMASHHADAALHGHDYARQQVVFQTVSAYSRLRQAKAQIEAMEGAVKAAEKRYQDAMAMQSRGMLIKSDVMDARVHLLRTSLKLEEAKNRHAASSDMLMRVMGVDGDVALHADEEPRLRAVSISIDEAIEQGLANRPDLRALVSQQQAAESGVTRSRAAFLPKVNLMASREWNNNKFALKNGNTTVGAMVTVNLFSGGSDAARMRAAYSEEVSLDYKVADLKQQVRNEVAQAWRQLAESRLRYESEDEALLQSEESLRIKSLRYEQGLASTSDLLDAQVQADSARVFAIGARYDMTIAEAALLLAIGKLNEEVIQ